jgi:alpha-D-xyloside xylohydrolase
MLSSHSRLHGNHSYRVPWLFDDESVEVLRSFTKLKHRLMPYLYATAVHAHEEGIPVLRPMVLEFPDDPACTHLDQQYMLGDSLLVAPVFNASGDVAYYVPEGRWTKLLTGETVDGPRWIRERHGFDSLPLLVRPGSVIPIGARDDRPDYSYVDGVTLDVFAFSAGVRDVPVPALDGSVAALYRVSASAGRLRVSVVQGADERQLLELRLDAERADTAHEVPGAGLQVRVQSLAEVSRRTGDE